MRDDLTKIHGAHAFKMGYEVLRHRLNATVTGHPSGDFRFDGMTAGLQTDGNPVPGTGNTFAGFLVGSVRQAMFDEELASWLPRSWPSVLPRPYRHDTHWRGCARRRLCSWLPPWSERLCCSVATSSSSRGPSPSAPLTVLLRLRSAAKSAPDLALNSGGLRSFCNRAARTFVTSPVRVESMNGNRQNIWFAVWGTSLCLLLAIAGALAQSPSPASAGSKLAEEEFKNIQALKGIPADQIIPSMQFIAASLGVECEFCHVAHANEPEWLT